MLLLSRSLWILLSLCQAGPPADSPETSVVDEAAESTQAVVGAQASKVGDQLRIDEQILQLGSQSFQARQRAERELIRLGKKSRPALERAAKANQDLETGLRIKNILAYLDLNPTPDLSLELLGLLKQFSTGSLDTRFNVLARLVGKGEFNLVDRWVNQTSDPDVRAALFIRSFSNMNLQVSLLRANRFRWWYDLASLGQPTSHPVEKYLHDVLTRTECLLALQKTDELSQIVSVIAKEIPADQRDYFIRNLLSNPNFVQFFTQPENYKHLFETLKLVTTDKEKHEALMSLFVGVGGFAMFEKSVYPQLHAFAASECLPSTPDDLFSRVVIRRLFSTTAIYQLAADDAIAIIATTDVDGLTKLLDVAQKSDAAISWMYSKAFFPALVEWAAQIESPQRRRESLLPIIRLGSAHLREGGILNSPRIIGRVWDTINAEADEDWQRQAKLAVAPAS